MKTNCNKLLIVSAVYLFSICGCSKDPGTTARPVVQLATITTTTASLQAHNLITGGNITNNGGDSVTERGICWNTLPNPTTGNNKIINGSGNGSFTSTIFNASPNTAFYIRAYAINSAGTAYGNQTSIQTQPVDSAKLIFIGGANYVYCFNAQNGILKWGKQLGGLVYSTPCYDNGMVFVGCNDAKLYAFDTTGVLKWSVSTGTQSMDFSSPVVLNGTVFISSNSKIFAYNSSTGALKWQYDPGPTSYVIGSLTISNNILYANLSGITAFNPETGAIIWTNYIQNRNMEPKIDGHRYYGVSDYSLNIVNADNGDLIRSTSLSISNSLSVNTAYGNIYLFKEDKLQVYDTLGNPKWSHSGNAVYYAFLGGGSSPVIRDSIVYMVNNGTVITYNAISGAQLSSFGSNINDADVTVVNGYCYFGTRDIFTGYVGYLYAVAVNANGVAVSSWRSNVQSDFTTVPCVVTASGKMYRAGDGG